MAEQGLREMSDLKVNNLEESSFFGDNQNELVNEWHLKLGHDRWLLHPAPNTPSTTQKHLSPIEESRERELASKTDTTILTCRDHFSLSLLSV